jgi:hypothetical protein
MEYLNYFVSSRGILKSCTIKNKNPRSSSSNIDEEFLDGITENASVYVCAAALKNFSQKFLPKVNKPFTLVTGDSDEHIDEHFINNNCIEKILKSKYLIHWFAQNLVTKHEKLSHLPAGLDYHTMHEQPGIWGMVRQSSMAQERALINVFAESSLFEHRYLVGYCNWHFHIDRGDRKECYEKISSDVTFYERSPVPRYTTWLRQSKCMFVVSPGAAGVDAHRTWEAMLLGCVPVLKRSEFTPLFDGLPVLILDDWGQFNAENIIKHIEYFKNSKFNFSKLFNQYWVNLINKNKTIELPVMTMSEFREFIFLNSY